MKIKVLRNLGAGLPSLKEGQTVDVDCDFGGELCKRGLAIDVTPPQAKTVAVETPPKEIHAVPEPPADLSPAPSALPEIGKTSVSKMKPAKADK